MLLLGWLAGCGEKVSVNGTEGDRHQENDSISRRVTGAVGPDAELAVWSSGIWTMNADGSNRTQVYDSSASDPAWAPDGEKVAFTRIVEESADASATPESIPSIVIMNADGSDQRELLDEPASDPAWSPDGKKIAFSKSTPNGLSFIYIMNADGCGKRRLTPPDSDNEHPEQGPAWSPGSLQCVR